MLKKILLVGLIFALVGFGLDFTAGSSYGQNGISSYRGGLSYRSRIDEGRVHYSTPSYSYSSSPSGINQFYRGGLAYRSRVAEGLVRPYYRSSGGYYSYPSYSDSYPSYYSYSYPTYYSSSYYPSSTY
jgi:hypothetical protein